MPKAKKIRVAVIQRLQRVHVRQAEITQHTKCSITLGKHLHFTTARHYYYYYYHFTGDHHRHLNVILQSFKLPATEKVASISQSTGHTQREKLEKFKSSNTQRLDTGQRCSLFL